MDRKKAPIKRTEAFYGENINALISLRERMPDKPLHSTSRLTGHYDLLNRYKSASVDSSIYYDTCYTQTVLVAISA